jgi:pilus assembly protein CpaE
MDHKSHILIVEDSEITLYKLKAILVRSGYLVTGYENPGKALIWMKTSGINPDLIISDVNMPDMDGFQFIKEIRSNEQTKKIPVILLTAQSDLKDKVAGLEAGADDYLVKTVSPTELELRVKALLTRAQPQEIPISQTVAKTYSIFSLKGGVGTTSLAINLSIAISQLWKIETVLWDMALSSGQCALMLNLKPKSTPASLVEWPESSIDETLLRTMLVEHQTGIKLLPAPTSFEDADLITPEIVDLIWSPLQTIAPYVIVDAGNHFTEAVISILARSDAIILVLTPELASVNAAYQAIRIFTEMGFDSNKVFPVINNVFPRSSLLPEKIASGLKKEIFGEIPFDTINFIKAINQGSPYLALAPKSPVSDSFTRLAKKLTTIKKEESLE